MVNSNHQIRNGPGKRCAFCDGKFGLIRHHSGKAALCSREVRGALQGSPGERPKWLFRFQPARQLRGCERRRPKLGSQELFVTNYFP
jgi:hypothetical protein